MNDDSRPTPLWLVPILLLLLLPLWPVIDMLDSGALSVGNDFVKLLAHLLPLFAIGDIVCAWMVYRRDKFIFGLLLFLLILCYGFSYWWGYLMTQNM